jgi:5''-nucleotidase/2'',3''-cyclic phosphodiesterase and related esterases
MRHWTIGLLLLINFSLFAQQEKTLVVLSMNDTHSRLEAIPDNDKYYPNKGGVLRQEAVIRQIREENSNVLVFHSGDFVQGTPYFNIFKGEAEIAMMNFMKIDAVAIGNHEFDYGLSTLKEMISAANFPFLSTNLDFSATILDGMTEKYIIIERENIKIGVIGLSPNPASLISESNYEGMTYLNPISSANETAALLKNEKECDLVICLSHLGYFPNKEIIDDTVLAKQSKDIDLILGGHSHTFLEEAVIIKNLDEKDVVITQNGERGVFMGRADIVLDPANKN